MTEKQFYKEVETCDCEDCIDSEDPCTFDCDEESECMGCYESKEEIEDYRFAIGLEQGRY